MAPEWLKEQVPPDWYERYGERIEDYRLPKDQTEREALSQRIGDDGYYLLARMEQAAQEGMDWLRQAPAVQTLAQTWAQPQQYRITNGQARRLTPQARPPVGEWLRSPDDPTTVRPYDRTTATCVTAAHGTWSGWATKSMSLKAATTTSRTSSRTSIPRQRLSRTTKLSTHSKTIWRSLLCCRGTTW